jgi:hypothetical protein
LTSAISGIARTGAQAAAASAAENGYGAMASMQRGNATSALRSWPLGYLIDSLFRTPAGAQPASTSGGSRSDEMARQEAARIFLNSAATGDPLPPQDIAWLSRLVAQHTGLAEDAASTRVTTTYTTYLQKLSAIDAAAKDAADTARKITIGASLWLFVSLLMGAFSASLAATYGGRVRQV